MATLRFSPYKDSRGENASRVGTLKFVPRTHDTLHVLYDSIVEAHNFISKLEAYCLVSGNEKHSLLNRWINLYNTLVENYNGTGPVVSIVVANKLAQPCASQ